MKAKKYIIYVMRVTEVTMYTIGIDLGGTGIKVGLCDENLNIVDRDSCPTLANRHGEEIVRDMAELTKKVIERNKLTLANIAYVGIATPGTVILKTGYVEYASNLPFKNFPMADLFKKYLPVEKVYIANDANAAALGEAVAGAGRGTRNSIMVTLGTGVGGGIILDGKIFSGGLNDAAGELGHMVIHTGGRPCSCGRLGCWEAYCSATALADITKAKIRELKTKNIPSLLSDCAEREGKVSARTAFNAKVRGDRYGEEIVNEYIFNLAAGITNLINAFQPEVICIGGGVSNEKSGIAEPVAAIVSHEQYTRHAEKKCQIKIASLGNTAGIIGAAALGR
jgi:glucokinase